jgi:hypothetical protein
MPSITWDPGDSEGERTLPCVVEQGRFNRWKMMPKIQGEAAEGVGDGVGYIWKHRTDYVASMELQIAHSDGALLHEFLEWAGEFRRFTIETDDADDNTYDECQIKVGTEADVSPPDPETLDYVLSMTVTNVALVPVPLLIRHE